MGYPQVILRKGKEVSVLRKHPWIFSGAIFKVPKQIEDGQVVEIQSADGIFLATGHYQGGSSIAVRILSFTENEINTDFWKAKLKNAIEFRRSVGLPSSETNAYRLIHGEGDGLPGLVIDIYNDVAVVQCHSLGIYRASEDIAAALAQVTGKTLDSIYLRCRDTMPEHTGEELSGDKFIKGNREETTIVENGIKFLINVVKGQKTGFFLDQRENRKLLGSYSSGKTVCNCFSYTGGFSLYSLMAGARSVESVDISQQAVALLDENLKLNDFGGSHTSVCNNVMHYLASEETGTFDIVVVDPPAFAKSLHKRHNAVQAYKRLNQLAIKKVKKGGFLFTFSCSQVVGTQLFYDTIVAAGIESGRSVRVVASLSQGPDHPVNLFHPEGHYLKGLILCID